MNGGDTAPRASNPARTGRLPAARAPARGRARRRQARRRLRQVGQARGGGRRGRRRGGRRRRRRRGRLEVRRPHAHAAAAGRRDLGAARAADARRGRGAGRPAIRAGTHSRRVARSSRGGVAATPRGASWYFRGRPERTRSSTIEREEFTGWCGPTLFAGRGRGDAAGRGADSPRATGADAKIDDRDEEFTGVCGPTVFAERGRGDAAGATRIVRGQHDARSGWCGPEADES